MKTLVIGVALALATAGLALADQPHMKNALTALQTAMDTTRAAFEQMAQASSEAFQLFAQPGAPKGKK